jgi:ribosomal protein L40E
VTGVEILIEAKGMNDISDISLYDLGAAQITQLLNDYGLTPESGSPLGGCMQLGPEPIAHNSPPAGALQCLAQPQRVLAATAWPPPEVPVRWYYGRNDQVSLVQHEIMDTGRHLLVWPVPYAAVAEALIEPMLGYMDEIAVGEFRLTTDRDGIQLLAALCDAMQEQEVRGLLQRATADAVAMNDAGLLQALQSSLAADDLRWCAARLSRMSPMALNQGVATLQPAIERFMQDNLVRPEDDGYRPTPPLAAICARWNGADAFSAVTERRLDPGGRWEWEHQAFLHAAGGMFRFEFSDIGRDGYGLAINEIATADMLGSIESLLLYEVEAATVEVQDAGAGACRVCGGELPPGASFCTQCGTAVTPAADQASSDAGTRPQTVVCKQCGGDLKPDARFCTQCGAKVIVELSEA